MQLSKINKGLLCMIILHDKLPSKQEKSSKRMQNSTKFSKVVTQFNLGIVNSNVFISV